MPRRPTSVLRVLLLTALFAPLPAAVGAVPATGPATRPADAVVVPRADLERIESAAIFAETANAAGLDWKPYYLTFMKLERRKDWTDKQIKFIGMYFGAVQGSHAERLRERAYGEEEIRALRQRLEEETARLDREATTRPYRKRGE